MEKFDPAGADVIYIEVSPEKKQTISLFLNLSYEDWADGRGK
jgi:hypothetical protein